MSRKVFWPNNPIYLAFHILLVFVTFVLMLEVLKWPILVPFPTFIMVVLVIFYFSQRVVIDDKYIHGPIAYGKRRKTTKIPRTEAEAFFEEGKYGFGHIVIRHKHSSKQILVPSMYFASFTIEEMKKIFNHPKMTY